MLHSALIVEEDLIYRATETLDEPEMYPSQNEPNTQKINKKITLNNEAKRYKEASRKEKWIDDMKNEINALIENQT